MPSSPTSRKLCHVVRYLILRQSEIVDSLKTGKDWNEFKREFNDVIEAALLVERLREDALNW